MDCTAINKNISIDDFDSVLSYPDQSVWETPDPSSPSFSAGATPWWMGTYHKTEIVGASLTFNFTGPAIFVYGQSGPSYGSYEVEIDSKISTLNAYAANDASEPTLLYGASNLTYAFHTLTLRNAGTKNGNTGGNAFLFDYFQTTIQLAPAGATVSNITYEEDDPALKYSGNWSSNKSPNFSGGGTSYTNEDKATVSLSFRGCTIYVFGDKKNDHGLYSITLDNKTAEVYNGVSGCGGTFGETCEQMKPSIKYIASNLDDSLHTLTIENLAGINKSFFDLDSIVVTVPSVYAPRQLSDSELGSTFTTSPLAPSTTSTSQNNSATGLLPLSNLLLLLLCLTVMFRSGTQQL